jgi:hypothetical protein
MGNFLGELNKILFEDYLEGTILFSKFFKEGLEDFRLKENDLGKIKQLISKYGKPTKMLGCGAEGCAYLTSKGYVYKTYFSAMPFDYDNDEWQSEGFKYERPYVDPYKELKKQGERDKVTVYEVAESTDPGVFSWAIVVMEYLDKARYSPLFDTNIIKSWDDYDDPQIKADIQKILAGQTPDPSTPIGKAVNDNPEIIEVVRDIYNPGEKYLGGAFFKEIGYSNVKDKWVKFDLIM